MSHGPGPRRVEPAPETISTATPAQLIGLVRIVASIGYDGRGLTGTGMVLTSDGEVVTNRHVVEGATAVQAKVMSTGRTYTARVVATDAVHDVALLQLSGASGLATVTPAKRDAAVGDPVTVVGDGKGRRDTFTAATGAVRAVNQTLVAPAEGPAKAERLTGLTLSSADVVTGDSGGATYGVHGRVVGMTTAATYRGRRVNGLAIPVTTLLAVVRTLR